MNIDSQIETVLRKRFPRVQILESHSVQGEERVLLRRRNLVEALRFLQNDPDTQLDALVDLAAIHHVEPASCIFSRPIPFPFFEVFYLLRSTRLRYRLRVSVMVPQQFAGVPTVSSVFRNANWLEREMWDLCGIFVENHPDLRRLLMYPSFEGHPLAKDYHVHNEQPLVLMKFS